MATAASGGISTAIPQSVLTRRMPCAASLFVAAVVGAAFQLAMSV